MLPVIRDSAVPLNPNIDHELYAYQFSASDDEGSDGVWSRAVRISLSRGYTATGVSLFQPGEDLLWWMNRRLKETLHKRSLYRMLPYRKLEEKWYVMHSNNSIFVKQYTYRRCRLLILQQIIQFLIVNFKVIEVDGGQAIRCFVGMDGGK